MEKIMGNELRQGQFTITTPKFENCQFIAIYYGAHWAPPCRLFTNTLLEFYEMVNKNQFQLEVLFVSLDGSREAFESHYKSMPWLAVPYTDESRIFSLK